MKSYEIHDNGGRPFRVDIQGNTVTVWMTKVSYEKVDGEFKDIVHPPKQILEVTTDRIFVGKKSPKGGYDGLKPKEAEGNSILLQVGAKYVYIGSEIIQFSPMKDDTIEKYYSDIGNSDVPYPYAIGKTHVYIMLDKVAVSKDFFDMKKGIYEQYYEATTYLKDRLSTLSKEDKVKARARMDELDEQTTKLKTKVLQKRI
jgi:hypothetical protein